MRSAIHDVLPLSVKRSLVKLGADFSVARRKRKITIAMMAERMGVAKTTLFRAERGDPTVSLGVYAMALFVLGFGDALSDLVDPRRDDTGMILDSERIVKRVRPRKDRAAL